MEELRIPDVADMLNFAADLTKGKEFVGCIGKFEQLDFSIDLTKLIEVENEPLRGKIEIVPKNSKGENIAHKMNVSWITAEFTGDDVDCKCIVSQSEEKANAGVEIRLFVLYELTRTPASPQRQLVVRLNGKQITPSPMVINVSSGPPRGRFLSKWGSKELEMDNSTIPLELQSQRVKSMCLIGVITESKYLTMMEDS